MAISAQDAFNAHEGKEIIRRASMRFRGTLCCIVRWFIFDATYAQFSVGLMHCHDVKPLADVGEECMVDSIGDLHPQCLNCQTMNDRRGLWFCEVVGGAFGTRNEMVEESVEIGDEMLANRFRGN